MSQYVDASTFFIWEDDRERTLRALQEYDRYVATMARARLEAALRAYLLAPPKR